VVPRRPPGNVLDRETLEELGKAAEKERLSVVTGLAQGYAPKGLHGQTVFPRSFEDSGWSLIRR